MITKHARLRINAIHGDFLGSLGPILINLWKKAPTSVDRDSIIASGIAWQIESHFRERDQPWT